MLPPHDGHVLKVPRMHQLASELAQALTDHRGGAMIEGKGHTNLQHMDSGAPVQ